MNNLGTIIREMPAGKEFISSRKSCTYFNLDYSWKYHKAHDIRLYAIF